MTEEAMSDTELQDHLLKRNPKEPVGSVAEQMERTWKALNAAVGEALRRGEAERDNRTCALALTDKAFALRVELDKARAALSKFGQHLFSCAFRQSGLAACDCGLIAVQKGLQYVDHGGQAASATQRDATQRMTNEEIRRLRELFETPVALWRPRTDEAIASLMPLVLGELVQLRDDKLRLEQRVQQLEREAEWSATERRSR